MDDHEKMSTKQTYLAGYFLSLYNTDKDVQDNYRQRIGGWQV